MTQPDLPEGDSRSVINIIRNELFAKAEWYPQEENSGARCKVFVSKADFEGIMTHERIDLVLEEILVDSRRREELSKRIRDPGQSPCVKLLAVMITSEQEQSYPGLVLDGKMNDYCLPIRFPDDDDHAADRPPVALICWLGHSHSHKSIASAPAAEGVNLSLWSYALVPPFLELGAEKRSEGSESKPEPKHYVFGADEVLPILFTHTGDQWLWIDHGLGESSTVQAKWRNAPPSKNAKFAIKRILDPQHEKRGNYKKERVSMAEYGEHNHRHLMPLLATFEVKGQDGQGYCEYGFILPRARGPLRGRDDKARGFFESIGKNSDAQRMMHRDFMLHQCWKLVEALELIHKSSSHGDITPYNIIWFDVNTSGIGESERQGRLVLADFGILSLEDINRRQLYRPPECFLGEGKVSRASDIFSLGVVFLQFATWYVNGPAKELKDQFDIIWNDDLALFAVEDQGTESESATLKDGVTVLLSELRNSNPASDSKIIRFLDIVEKKMLQVDIGKRIKCSKLVQELEALSAPPLAHLGEMQEEIKEIGTTLEN